MALPAARRAGPSELPTDAAQRWFGNDVDAPVRWEPSGSDFLSPSLTEALPMAEVMPDFPDWLSGFLAGLADGQLFGPAVVSDPRDGQTAHLRGLNLSRAWAMRRLAAYKLRYLDSGY